MANDIDNPGGEAHAGKDRYPVPGAPRRQPPGGFQRPSKNLSESTAEVYSAVAEYLRNKGASEASGDMLAHIFGGQRPQEPEINKQVADMFGSVSSALTSVIQTEREAKQKAEDTSIKALQAYQDTAAARAHDLIEYAKQIPQAQPGQSIEERMNDLRAFQQFIVNEARSLIQQTHDDRPVVSASGIGPHDIEMEKMKLDQTRLLEQMRQNHEIAMKNIDLQFKKFDIEMAKWAKGTQDKTSIWEELTGAIGLAAQSGVREGVKGKQTIRQNTPPPPPPPAQETLPRMGCQNPDCGAQFPVAPNAKFAACPSCGTQYQISYDAPPAAEPEGVSVEPEPE